MKKIKINAVDVIIVLVILAIAIVFVFKYAFTNKTKYTGVVSSSVEMEYVTLISGIRQPTVDAIHIGDKLYDDTTDAYLGEIASIEVMPYFTVEVDAKSNRVEANKPDYFNVILKVKAPIIEKETGYYASGVVEIKLNSNLYTYTKYAKPTMQVTDIIR